MLNPIPPLSPRISPDQAEAYLRKRVKSELFGNIAGAVLAMAGAALIFFGIVFFSFLLAVNFHGRAPLSWQWLSLGISAFAFIAYAFTDPEYLSKLEIRTVDGRAAYTVWLPGGWRMSNVDFTNPKTAGSLAKIILQVLTAGPRALIASGRYAIRAATLRRIEPGALANMFALLAERGRRVPYEELAGHALRDPERAFSDLLLLDVAQPLTNAPQGLVIRTKCREEITGIKVDGMDF